jgi:hypothetical protein
VTSARFGSGKPTRAKTSTAPVEGFGLADLAVQQQRLADLVADRVQRRERGHRLLEDHRDPAAAQGPDGFALGIERRDVDRRRVRRRIVEQDRSAADAGDLRQDAQDRLRGHRLAGAGFADEGDRLAFRHVERQPVDGAEGADVGFEIDRQVANRQEGGVQAFLLRTRGVFAPLDKQHRRGFMGGAPCSYGNNVPGDG